jgi:hypothetical protein
MSWSTNSRVKGAWPSQQDPIGGDVLNERLRSFSTCGQSRPQFDGDRGGSTLLDRFRRFPIDIPAISLIKTINWRAAFSSLAGHELIDCQGRHPIGRGV